MIKWLQDSYNGLYKVLLEPVTPRRKTVLALVIGVLLGLFWAYVLAPVIFYDADPVSLHQTWQDEWVMLLADRRAAANANVDDQIIIFLREIDDPVGVVNRLITERPDNAARLQDLLPLAETAQQTAPAAPQPNLIGNILPFIIAPLLIALLFVIFTWLYKLFIEPNFIEPMMRRRRAGGAAGDDNSGVQIQQMRDDKARAAEQKSSFTTPPLMQRMSVYRSGYSQFDDSFSIEDAQERFLGECGASVSEKIGTGDQKVTAVEVWLFDKDDFVRTMTAVFASEYAYNDPALHAKLEPKGPITLIKPGAVATLETAKLRLQARVVEVEYADGPLPPNSAFEKLTIELAAWSKEGAPAGAPAAPVAPAAPAPLPTPIPAAPPATVITMPPAPTFTPPAPQAAPPPVSPSPAPAPGPFGGFSTPPRPPAAPPPMAPPIRPPTVDDDPFGGTGDFRPVR